MRTLEGIDTDIKSAENKFMQLLDDMRTLEGIDTVDFFLSLSRFISMLDDMRTLEGIDTLNHVSLSILYSVR